MSFWGFLTKKKGASESDSKDDNGFGFGILNWVAICLLVVGVIIVLLFGASISNKAVVFLWMLACLLAGITVGFLFGIPKIVQNSQTGSDKNGAPEYQQQVNTNLTEISDWLTKIIVGLSLVNLSKIHIWISSLAKILASGLSDSGSNDGIAFAFSYGTVVAYILCGFLFGYISTRLYLAGRFSEADQAAIRNLALKAEEAKGAAESAQQKADFALTEPARSELTGGNIQEKLAELSRKYVQTRAGMERGSTRTSEMTKIFKQMTAIAGGLAETEVGPLLQSPDVGSRLSGYAYLYSSPAFKFIEDLVTAIAADPTAFGQYWGIQALGKIMANKPEGEISARCRKQLKQYYENLPKGVDRKYELGKLMQVING